MSKAKIDNRPHTVGIDACWYEDKGGIIVVVESVPTTRQVRIEWPALLAAAERCGKLKR